MSKDKKSNGKNAEHKISKYIMLKYKKIENIDIIFQYKTESSMYLFHLKSLHTQKQMFYRESESEGKGEGESED